jgi:hypothetical protein
MEHQFKGKYSVGSIEDWYEWSAGEDKAVVAYIEDHKLTNPFLYNEEHWELIADAFSAGRKHEKDTNNNSEHNT